MLTTITYRATLNRNGRTTRDGLRTVVISIYQLGSRRRATISTGIRVLPADFANGRVQPSDPNHDLYNRKLRRRIRLLMELEDQQEAAGAHPTPHSISEAYRRQGAAQPTVADFITTAIATSARSESTKAAYQQLAHRLADYRPALTLEAISPDFIEQWRRHLGQQGLAQNTIKKLLKQLHCVTREAQRCRLLQADPFRHVVIGTMAPREGYLTLDDIGRLERLPLQGREALVRDLFLLACYTGLRWSDLATLDEATLTPDGILHKRTRKTGACVDIPVATLFWGRAMPILRRHQPLTRLAHACTNATANAVVKDLARRAGITRSVHFHLARKSCSTILYQLGLPAADIALILGHQRPETTQRYYIFGRQEALRQAIGKLFAAAPPAEPVVTT